MSRLMKATALLGLGVTLFGMGSMSGARADGTYDKLNANVRRSMTAVEEDQQHIHDMMTKRDTQKAHSQFAYAKQTSKDIHKAQQAMYRHKQRLTFDRRELASYKRAHHM